MPIVSDPVIPASGENNPGCPTRRTSRLPEQIDNADGAGMKICEIYFLPQNAQIPDGRSHKYLAD
jgi:hypothetical protein